MIYNTITSKNDKIVKEKTSILGQVIDTTGLADTIESKIENEMQILTDNMKCLKDSVYEAINGLKSQVEKSMNATILHQNQGTTQNTQNSVIQEPTEVTDITSANENQQSMESVSTHDESVQSRTFRALILGDSVTRILSSRRMSDTDIKVKIKSHSGGRLQDIHNSITRMAETDDESICTVDVILIHAGTNNLSDGDSEESVTEQLQRITEIVEDVNPFCKIIVSSILPHKSDSLGNQLIRKTNQSIEQLCRAKSYSYMENTHLLQKNGTPDKSLYQDNIHLNAKGGKGFGETISREFRELFKLPARASTVQEQDFQSGRQPGRSHIRKTANNRNKGNRGSSNNQDNNNNQN